MKRKFKDPAPGKLVNVNGHDLHVYTEGTGENTFVFMSGSGTRFPTLDFKPLWSILSVNHKIAVIEKAGYGWSDITKSSRDLDTMLDESREALKLAGLTAPYILVPHSMSGLEAVYWGQKYSDEVKAIIGLDPAVPEFYEKAKLVNTIAFLSRYDILTPDMVNELRCVKNNAVKVKNNPVPAHIPTYFFISNGKGTPVPVKDWEEVLVSYLTHFKIKKHMSLDCGHYVHTHETEKIASEIKSFIEDVL